MGCILSKKLSGKLVLVIASLNIMSTEKFNNNILEQRLNKTGNNSVHRKTCVNARPFLVKCAYPHGSTEPRLKTQHRSRASGHVTHQSWAHNEWKITKPAPTTDQHALRPPHRHQLLIPMSDQMSKYDLNTTTNVFILVL